MPENPPVASQAKLKPHSALKQAAPAKERRRAVRPLESGG